VSTELRVFTTYLQLQLPFQAIHAYEVRLDKMTALPLCMWLHRRTAGSAPNNQLPEGGGRTRVTCPTALTRSCWEAAPVVLHLQALQAPNMILLR
jgi:hypothetical protein